MKLQYTKPEISVEALIKEDILLISEEKENRYIKSTELFKDFSIEDIL